MKTKEIIEVVDTNYVKKVCKKLNVTNLSNQQIIWIADDVNVSISMYSENEPRMFSNREILEDTIFYYSNN